MTKHEKLVVSAYTGVLMTKFNVFHAYVENVLKRPVFTDEMITDEFEAELKQAVKDEFLNICKKED